MLTSVPSTQVEAEFIEAVNTKKPVAGLTHSFYRYPARFSPLFSRATIKLFTQPGDIVLDPFMGGGTTLVEASVLGRRSVGTDISTLAQFVAQVKTTILSAQDVAEIRSWADSLPEKLNLRNPSTRPHLWTAAGYQKNINDKITWPIRKTLELALAEVEKLPCVEQQKFARCVWLRTAQWALDSRRHIPSVQLFRRQFTMFLEEMIKGSVEYRMAVEMIGEIASPVSFRSVCLNLSASEIGDYDFWANNPAPKLVITSPPYPGVHVLYHRWQVRGRRETPAPFWIADSLDGNGSAFYTFGDRNAKDLSGYFEQIFCCFRSVAKIADRETTVVQLVAFSEPGWQLPRYLDVMEQAGFSEVTFSTMTDSPDGRLWRVVPNRKWYADQRGAIGASKEVVLFHRLRT